MNQPQGDTRDELMASRLVAYDEALAHNRLPPQMESGVDDGELATRLREAQNCLELLDRVRRLDAVTPMSKVEDTLLAVDGPARRLPASIGRFCIERELGRGGLGVVLLAKDPHVGRQVAIKIPRAELVGDGEPERRFLREAEAAARLSHPHLVTLHEVGRDGSLSYIVWEYCPGPTLAQWLRTRERLLAPRAAARLVLQLAEAVHHAHSRGVLHRDIKPSNILLEKRETRGRRPEEGTTNSAQFGEHSDADDLWPKLTDFGMAKLLESSGEQTRTGAVIGTPAYMAPEQADGRAREVDARTDVYALGAVLYELLTGAPPYRGSLDVDTLRQLLLEEPTSPRKLCPTVPRELEAICLKCISKDPSARYPTAQHLSEDLDRYLSGQPTQARPLSPLTRAGKWARRRPTMAALVAVATFSFLVLLVVVMGYNARLSDEVVRADASRDDAEREAAASRRLLYTADVRVAYETLKANNVVQALKVLDRQIPRPGHEDLREFAWYYLREQCEPPTLTLAGHEKPVMAVAFSPSGDMVASGGGDGTTRLWDAATGKPLRIVRDDATEVTCVAFAPDGRLLATGYENHAIRFWDPATGEKRLKLRGHDEQVLAIAFSPDGEYLASGGGDTTVQIWEVTSGGAITKLAGSMDVIRSVAFSPRGDLLYAVDEGESVHVWRTGNWERLAGASSPREKFFALAISPTGTRVAAAGRREVISVWESNDGQLKPLADLLGGHNEWIQSLAYSPLDDTLASAGKDSVLRLWKPDDAAPYRTLLGHTDRIWSVAWSPDGRRLASGGADGTVKIWSPVTERAEWLPPLPGIAYGCDFSADGSRLATACDDGIVQVWNVATRSLVNAVAAHNDVRTVRFSPDGSLIATRGADGTTKLTKRWQSDGSQLVFARSAEPSASAALAFDPRGRYLATTVEENTVVFVDVESNQIIRQFPHKTRVRKIDFTPDGRCLVSTSQSLQIWDVTDGRIVYEQEESHGALAVARNSRVVAAATGSNVTLIDLASGQNVSTLVTIGSDVTSLDVSPDGRTLAAGLRQPGSGAVSLWDIRTRQLLMQMDCDIELIHSVAFAPDGRRLVATGAPADGRGFIWEWTIRSPPRALSSH